MASSAFAVGVGSQRTQSAMPRWRYTVAAVLALCGIRAILLAPHPENRSHIEFEALLKAGEVSELER